MSLSLTLRHILDKIGSGDSRSPTESPDVTLPGPATPESIALEESIRSLVARFRELEHKTIHSEHFDAGTTRPVLKQLHNVKEGNNKKDGLERYGCMSCGHPLNGVPLTPDETSPVDINGRHVPTSSLFTEERCVNR